MSFGNDDLILRHVSIFRSFCVAGRDAILEMDVSKLPNGGMIVFSERIYVPLLYFFKESDESTVATIWEYLLTLSAILDPLSDAKRVLKQHQLNVHGAEFTGVPDIEQLGNPMDMINAFASNPAISQLLSGMLSGDNGNNTNLEGATNDILQGMLSQVTPIAEQLLANMTDENGNSIIEKMLEDDTVKKLIGGLGMNVSDVTKNVD